MFYDIRLHFQGTNDKGNMNAKSDDATYTELIATLREKMKLLAKRIEPKVYEYGFLKWDYLTNRQEFVYLQRRKENEKCIGLL